VDEGDATRKQRIAPARGDDRGPTTGEK